MALNKLSDKAIRAMKATDKLVKESDGGGLYLIVPVTGRKWFRFDYRFGGKQQSLSLGAYGEGPDTTLKDARDERDRMRKLLKKGINPSSDRKAERAIKEAAAEAEAAEEPDGADGASDAEGPTFANAADGWRNLINKKPRSAKTMARDALMVRYLVDAFGSKAVKDVKTKDLVDLLVAFEDDGSFETRRRLQATALHIGGFAQVRFDLPQNPFIGINLGKAFTGPVNEPRPAITEAKPFGKLLRAMSAYQGGQGDMVVKALELLALTFVRPGTVIAAEWSEIDLDAALWTIPFARLKQRKFRAGIAELKGKPHLVPLSRQAVALLRNLHKRTANGRYLFPGRRHGQPIATSALNVALRTLGYQDVHCPHGFRSTASTMLNAERIKVGDADVPRFDRQAIEFQLEHIDASIAGIYDRDPRMPERTKMMQFWGDKVDQMRGSNIVSMKLA
jgi:integrase